MSRKSPKAISKSQTIQQTADLQPESLETEELATQEPIALVSKISPIGNTPNPNAHAAMINRAAVSSQSSQQAILQLQRQYGNRYVNRVLQQTRQLQTPIQAKLTLGAVGDKYEQEADRVAKQVVNQIQTSQSSSTTQTTSMQREMMPEEDELQRKTVNTIQREGMLDEENELGMNAVVERAAIADGGTITPDLETSIQQARGSGQRLPDNIRQPMEQALGADFSGVKIHTDAQSHQLNQAVQAKAFTTGKDVFFRQGAYEPGSREGQELIAHELTHVVQQKAITQQVNQTSNRLQRQPIGWHRIVNANTFNNAYAAVQQNLQGPNGVFHTVRNNNQAYAHMTFAQIWAITAGKILLKQEAQNQFASENTDFLHAVDVWRAGGATPLAALNIYNLYISDTAPQQVNIPANIKNPLDAIFG
jgi:Domain of unknown function (DUF4157)